MPTYKQRPHSGDKSTDKLPFYRPIDRLAVKVVENRNWAAPLVAAVFLLLILFGAFKAYTAHYEKKASELFSRGETETVVKDYGRSKAAKTARMKLGEAALEAQEYDRAIDWYGPVADDQKKAPALLRVAAKQNLALAYLKKGDTAKAAEQLREAIKDPENAGDDYSELLLARVQEMAGDKDKALEIYRTLSEGANEPAVKSEAGERRTWLESSGQ